MHIKPVQQSQQYRVQEALCGCQGDTELHIDPQGLVIKKELASDKHIKSHTGIATVMTTTQPNTPALI